MKLASLIAAALVALLLSCVYSANSMATTLPIPLDFDTAQKSMERALSAAPAKLPVIDLLIVHDSAISSDRVAELLAITNKALADSGARVQVNKICETVDNAWRDKQPSQALGTLVRNARDPRARLTRLVRNACRADLVAYIAPLRAADDVCGVSPTNIHFKQALGFTVVRDGIAGGFYCDDTTLAHELGHQFGNDHDRAHAEHNMLTGYTGVAYPFSFGYGIDGQFGDIMSYLAPKKRLYSTPNVNCLESIPCGNADNDAARTINLTARRVAGYR